MEQLISKLDFLITSNICLLEVMDFIKFFNFSPINIDGFFPREVSKNSIQRKIIHRNSNYEIIVIYWPAETMKDYHYHPNNGCILYVLTGKLLEIIKKNNDHKEYQYLRENGDTSYIDDHKGIHKIVALEDSISIHIYSPPGFYDN
jgi:hypothetical protein